MVRRCELPREYVPKASRASKHSNIILDTRVLRCDIVSEGHVGAIVNLMMSPCFLDRCQDVKVTAGDVGGFFVVIHGSKTYLLGLLPQSIQDLLFLAITSI